MNKPHNPNETILYLLVRNDIPSITEGKMAVQISHLTADLFTQTLREEIAGNRRGISEWLKTNRSGNVVILTATGAQIEYLYHNSAPLLGVPEGMATGDHTGLIDACIFKDTGYVLNDGPDEHTIEKFTGAWFLAQRRAGNKLFRHLPLFDGVPSPLSSHEEMLNAGVKIGHFMSEIGFTPE